MKNFIILITMLLITCLFYSGCGKSEQESNKDQAVENTANNSSGKMSVSAQARFDDLKKDYIAKAKSATSELNDQVRALQQKKKGAPESLQEPIEAYMKIAVDKNAELAKQLRKLENCDEEDYPVEKTAMEKAIIDARSAYEDLKSQF